MSTPKRRFVLVRNGQKMVFRSTNPIGAAKKAASSIFRDSSSDSARFTIKERVGGETYNYVYTARCRRYSRPRVVRDSQGREIFRKNMEVKVSRYA
jgi:hypothetical protein